MESKRFIRTIAGHKESRTFLSQEEIDPRIVKLFKIILKNIKNANILRTEKFLTKTILKLGSTEGKIDFEALTIKEVFMYGDNMDNPSFI